MSDLFDDDLDGARDVRDALGTLLADEPASAPWSAADDVARGRALQRRRRTRWTAGVGLVAAVSLVLAVVGPWRPADQPVQPGGTTSGGTDFRPSVTRLLASMGVTVDSTSIPYDAAGSDDTVVFTVHRTSTPWAFGQLTVTVFAGGSLSTGDAFASGSIVGRCDGETCEAVRSTVSTGTPGGEGPVEAWTTTKARLGAAAARSLVVYGGPDQGGPALEIAASHWDCLTCSWAVDPGTVVDLAQARQVLRAVRDAFVAATPTMPAPTGRGLSGCTADDLSLDVAIDPVPTPYPIEMLLITVTPRTAAVRCLLDSHPPHVDLVSATDVVLLRGPEVVDAMALHPTQIGPDSAQFTVSRNLCAAGALTPATMRVTFQGIGPADVPLDSVVSDAPTGCASFVPTPSERLGISFLQRPAQASGTSASASAACSPDDVKLVPATDPAGGATGERSFAVEVHPVNPGVLCTLSGYPQAQLLVGGSPAPALTYREGAYQQPSGAPRAVTVDASHTPLFVVAKHRCDTGTVGEADGVSVRLPGWTTSTLVELGSGIGPSLCVGTGADPGHEVWVSAIQAAG